MPKTEEQFKKAVAIITARGGSKRIPHKNIRDFCGRPILSYSIRAALESGAFDEVMVSTDDDEIVRVARQWGAAVPFLRSQDTSGDYASTDDVILEVIRDYEKQGIHFERFCCLYPTAPFLTAQRLREAMALLDTAESVMPVVAFSYPPQRGLIVERMDASGANTPSTRIPAPRIWRKYIMTADSSTPAARTPSCGTAPRMWRIWFPSISRILRCRTSTPKRTGRSQS